MSYRKTYSFIFSCFSRDKTNLNELITDEAIKIILQNADLAKICEEEQISYTAGKNEFSHIK